MLDDNQIKDIKNKIDKLGDKELKSLLHELIKERNLLAKDIKIDYLTGAYNKRVIEDIKKYGVVVMCDVDNFKSINDQYGHSVGDDILKLVAEEIKNHIRMNDILVRYGGDEFLIIFNYSNVDIIVNRMTLIQERVNKRSRGLNVTISVGMSLPREGLDINETIKEADKALYESKGNGKGIITVYNPDKQQILCNKI